MLLHCHDLGRHLGCYGAQTLSSPRLDALAAEGVLLTQMSAAAPQCSPSRSALFTGRWPHSNGVLGLTHSSFGWDLHDDEQHLAALLGGAGYATELIGVHHESAIRPDAEVADQLGFDSVVAEGLADEVADRTTAALDRLAAGDRPFYLQVGFLEPHRLPGPTDPDGVLGFLGEHRQPDTADGVQVPPWLIDDESARVEIAELQGAIKAMDAAAGRVLDALARTGAAENTIAIFTTDHGLALPRAKCSLYEPGLDVAFLIRWPAAGWSGGRRVDGLVSNVDVVPTLLDAIGLDVPATPREPAVQGRSFRPLIEGSGDGRSEVFAEMTYHDYYDPRRSVRTERWKLIANFSSAPAFMDPSQGWVRRCTAKPVDHDWTDYHPPIELYDLQADPLETTDLAGSADDHPEHGRIRDELAAALLSWMGQTGDPLLAGAVTGPLHRRTTELLEQGGPKPTSSPVAG